MLLNERGQPLIRSRKSAVVKDIESSHVIRKRRQQRLLPRRPPHRVSYFLRGTRYLRVGAAVLRLPGAMRKVSATAFQEFSERLQLAGQRPSVRRSQVAFCDYTSVCSAMSSASSTSILGSGPCFPAWCDRAAAEPPADFWFFGRSASALCAALSACRRSPDLTRSPLPRTRRSGNTAGSIGEVSQSSG